MHPARRLLLCALASGLLFRASASLPPVPEPSPGPGHPIKAGYTATPSLVPSRFANGESLTAADHPLASTIMTFLSRQTDAPGFVPTGLSRGDYLRLVRAQVECFAATLHPSGEVRDPVGGSTYATGSFTFAAAVVARHGKEVSPALVDAGLRAMDFAVATLAESSRKNRAHRAAGKKNPSGTTDFLALPVMMAYELWTGIASPERLAAWRRALSEFHPLGYALWGTNGNNWPAVHMAGEFLRYRAGMCGPEYIDWVFATQKHHFTPQGLWMEWGAPFAYDAFARYFFTVTLHHGYAGAHADFYRRACWQGAWTSLLSQSPHGELPTAYRSAHHIWNEGTLAAVFELYARHHAAAGQKAEAGAFKRGARLALQSLSQWVRPDGSAYIVKNRFPIEDQPKAANPHSTYSLLAAQTMAMAYLVADDAVEERPSPADVGGYAFRIPEFNTVIANAGGTYVQYLLRGNHIHNPTGLLRVHLRGAPAQLGPSDGLVEWFGYGHKPRPDDDARREEAAIGPAWTDASGNLVRLAWFPDKKPFKPSEHRPDSHPYGNATLLSQETNRVVFQVDYDWPQRGVRIREVIELSPVTGVTIRASISGSDVRRIMVTYPTLVHDGESEVALQARGPRLELGLRGGALAFEVLDAPNAALSLSEKTWAHYNGLMRIASAEVPGKTIAYRIAPVSRPKGP